MGIPAGWAIAAGIERLPIVLQITSNNAAPTLGNIAGTTTRKSVRCLLAPHKRDCSSSAGSRLRKAAEISKKANVVPCIE